jgi:sugar O-acyltransferase (sialic acid O-acetyltransferase NeuD family)
MDISNPQLQDIIFWGATGQAKVLRECLKLSGMNLIALFDNNETIKSPFSDVPLYVGKKGFEEWRKTRDLSQSTAFLVAIGGDKGEERIKIQQFLESYGLIALIAKHPTAFIADSVKIGNGSQILANSTVCVETTLGRGCIINTGATVDHECRLDDGVHICPGANLAGCIEVQRYCMIGTGAVVLPRLKIGEGAVVGAGAVVIEDIPPYTVVVGNPARVIREISRQPNHIHPTSCN